MSQVNPAAVPYPDYYIHATEPPHGCGMPPPTLPPPPYDQYQTKQVGGCPQTYPGTVVVHSQTMMSPAMQNQVVVIDGRGVHRPVHYRAADSYVGPLVFSCFVIWCFNIVFGLIAFVLAVMANNASIADRDGARRLSRASYIVSGTGIIVTAVVIGITVGVIFGCTSAVTTDVTSFSNNCAYYVNRVCYSYRTADNTYCFGYSGYDGYCYYNLTD